MTAFREVSDFPEGVVYLPLRVFTARRLAFLSAFRSPLQLAPSLAFLSAFRSPLQLALSSTSLLRLPWRSVLALLCRSPLA